MSLFSRVKSWFRNEDPDYQDTFVDEGGEVLVEEAPQGYAGETDYPSASVPATEVPDYAAEIAPATTEFEADPQSSGESVVRLPLAPIIAGLPQELRTRLLVDNVGDATISIPVSQLLPQLSRGFASLTFGGLREAAHGAFSSNTDLDEHQVNLPLSVVLPRITPDMIARRHPPRKFHIPDEIVSPFAGMGRGLKISEVQRGSAATASGVPHQEQASATPPVQPAPTAPVPVAQRPAATPAANLAALRASARTSSTLTTAQPKVAVPPRPAERASVSSQRPPGVKGVPPVAKRPAAAVHPSAGPSAAPQRPAGVPLSSLPGSTAGKPAPLAPSPISGAGLPKPSTLSPARQPIAGTGLLPQQSALAPVPPPAPPAQAPSTSAPEMVPAPAGERPPLMVQMSAVSEFWPENIKGEVALLNATSARIALPYTAVEAGLRKGRLSFSWQQLRSWIRPAVPGQPSANDTLQLELPLRSVAPLFIAQQKAGAQRQQRVSVDMGIPDLFSGGEESPADQAEDHVVTRPVDTNFYVWTDEPGVAAANRAQVKREADMGETEFLRRATTPNEVVTRAAALPGIEGALVALPDGLLVSSKLPAGVNGDTLAAFLPHLYGKVTQCTQELRMGELNNLKFTVGNVPWKVYRVNALYFAAFGKAGEPLPGAELHVLAMELDRRAKE